MPACLRPQRPRHGGRRRSLWSGLCLQGLVLPTEGCNTLLPFALRPEPFLLLLLTQYSNVMQQLRFLRVHIGRKCATGLKAARCGLLCGHTPDIGGSTADELLCGSYSKGLGDSAARHGLLCCLAC